MINIAIVEDDDNTRQRLQNTVRESSEMFVCGTFSSAESLIEKYKHLDVHVVLMDIDLGKTGMNGIEAVRQLSAINKDKEVEFIICTSYVDDEKIFKAYSYGAHGYLNKSEIDDEKIIHAIKQVIAGGRPMTPLIAQKTLAYFQRTHSQNKRLENLTNKERETLELLAKGYSQKMAAEKMNISYNTITGYVKNTYVKLNVHCLAEAIKILNE